MTSKDAEYSRRYRERHPERRRASSLAYDARNRQRIREYHRTHYARPDVKARARAYHLWRTYGITLEEFAALQAEGCPCGNPEWDARPRSALSPVVDHDRESGLVRGVIHHLCNRSLGVLGDNTEGLERWMRYLETAANGGQSDGLMGPSARLG